MKTVGILFAIYFLAFVGLAQQPTNGYFGFVQLQNHSLIEGNVALDFEKQILTIYQGESANLQTKVVPFVAIASISCYDEAKHLRREFMTVDRQLYEVVLAGELALLRKYEHNLVEPNTTGVNYYFYDSATENLVATLDINQYFEQIFAENSALVQHLVQKKSYNLADVQHLASLVRYHNQCRAKSIAKR